MPQIEIAKLNQKLEDHIEHTNARFDKGDERFDIISKCLMDNTAAVNRSSEETKELVTLWHDIQGVTRIGMSVQRFGIWVIKWPLIGGGLYTAYHWVVQNLHEVFK